MRRNWFKHLLGLSVLGFVACQEQTPTSVDAALLPVEPFTLEIEIPWAEFASNLAVFGGYGSARDLGTGVAAKAFGDSLDANTLLRFGAYPTVVSVRDTAGTTRPDSALTFIGGRVVAHFDTIASTADGPVTLGLGAIGEAWHPATANWTTAVDTINDRREWTVPGGGPVVDLSTSVWDPAVSDSVAFMVDSATVAAWADTANLARGARIELITPGARLHISRLELRLDTRSSLNPDSIFDLVAASADLTFIYAPFPEPPPDGIRVGGVPAWRTVLDLAIPKSFTGPAALCAAVGCPHSLTSSEVSYAALVLRSRLTALAYQPTDTIGIDVRPVFSRAALPKAPLGNSLTGLTGRRIGPDFFGTKQGTAVEIPITLFVRDLVEGADPNGRAPPNTLALLSVFEPVSISFASFYGPGVPEAPVLKLIVTVGRSVEFP